ncbi:cobalt-precorrin-6A reductase [Roseibium sp. SCP14]|uniref:cobalt-precorrin-6A reductase n=1 Tax=Roseibium sp. SCP14 TaxID=3141375 RepID=UPI003335B236
MTTPEHILLLAGTQEARQLAGRIAAEFPQLRLTASFAGAVRDLPDLGVPTRVGGFGGVDGLVRFLRSESINLIIDATHPFAAQMSRNAALAAETLSIPVIRLERPAWQAGPRDLWQSVASMNEAANALAPGARAFLAIGRKEIQAFTKRSDIYGLARMIEPPSPPLPASWDLILTRPPHSADEEAELFRARHITHVVTKNSGGERSYAKIEAARHLQLPVIMIERPKLPEVNSVPAIMELLDKTREFLPLS